MNSPWYQTIDLFTDMAAILNELDLRSIIGCPRGTRSVFTHAFRAKRELHCIFLGEKAIVITTMQTRHNDLSSHYNYFASKILRKNWASHNTP